MGRSIIIDGEYPDEIRAGIIENDKLLNFFIESESKATITGNIYLGKISRIEWSIGGAFVDFGLEKNGLIRLTDLQRAIFVEDGKIKKIEDFFQPDKESSRNKSKNTEATTTKELTTTKEFNIKDYTHRDKIHRMKCLLGKNLMIQISKEARDGKGAHLSGTLSILGRYCIFLPNDTELHGVSKKITGQIERQRLKTIIESLKVPNDSGFIVRSASKDASEDGIKRDYKYLQKTWQTVLKTASKNKVGLLYEEASLVKRLIRDYCNASVNEIIVSSDNVHKSAKSAINLIIQENSPRLTFDKHPNIFDKYNLTSQIESIYKEEIVLESGAKIIIQQTAACISIDVNSHKAKIREGNAQLSINIEAAAEIARQIILRNIAGIIVIDFIDVYSKHHQVLIKQALQNAMADDRSNISIYDMNELCIICMSRERIGNSLMEISMEDCSSCCGIGKTFEINTKANQILRKIAQDAEFAQVSRIVNGVVISENAKNSTTDELKTKSKEITVEADDKTVRYILNNKKDNLFRLEKLYSKRIYFTDIEKTPPEAVAHLALKSTVQSTVQSKSINSSDEVIHAPQSMKEKIQSAGKVLLHKIWKFKTFLP